MSCRKPCRQRSRESARDILLAEEHVLPWQIFPQTTMAIHRSSKYCLPAPALPVRFHKKAEIEFQALQCYGELRESLCCRYAISGAPVPKNVSDLSCESGEGAHRWSPFFTGPPESQLDSHGPPKCDDDQNSSCDLVGMGSCYVVSTAVRLPALSRYGIQLISPHRSNRKNRTQDLRRLRRYRTAGRLKAVCLAAKLPQAGGPLRTIR